jgi:hypothetical protein
METKMETKSGATGHGQNRERKQIIKRERKE